MKCPSSRPTFDSAAGECVKRAPCLPRCPAFATIIVSQNETTNLTTQDDPTTTITAVTSITNTADALPSLPPPPSSSIDCQPVCLVPDSWLADPTDCRYFYVCHFLRDVIPEPKRIRCPSNRPVFDQTLGRCSAGGVCKVFCNESTPISIPDMSPEPSCHPKCLIPNTRVPDPSDCKHYYVCMLMGTLTPQPIRSRCPDAKPFFDSSKNICVEKTECKLPCPLTDATIPSPLESPGVANDPCSPRCVESQTIVPDPRDCGHYYVCDGSPITATKMKCPSHQPYFDTATTSCSQVNTCKNTCGQNSTVTSSSSVSTSPSETTTTTTTVRPGSCRPRCSAHNTIVHDPLDCHHYYVCMVVDGKHHLSRVKCPKERPVFDLSSYSCQRTAPCILTCADNVITDPPTTDVAAVTIPPSSTAAGGSTIIPASDQNPGITQDSDSSVIQSPGSPINVSDTSGSAACEPVHCSKAGVLLADLSNCNRYYACVYVDSLAPRPVHATCPKRTPIFHFSKKRCVAEAECYQPCPNQSVAVTLPAASDTSVTAGNTPSPEQPAVEVDACAPQCGKLGGLVADPRDCRFYYICSGPYRSQDPVRVQCPFDRPVFDRETLQCSGGATCAATCPSSSTPGQEGSDVVISECTHAGHFAKSHTCQSLYTHCYEKDDRLVKATKKCPPGLVFNTVSTYPYCVPPEDCPYDPAIKGPSINGTTCRHPGSFPRCHTCCSDFLRCEATGDEFWPVEAQCPGGLVFNTDPRYPVCVRPQDCSRNEPASDHCDKEGYYPACQQGCCKDYYFCTDDGHLLHRSCPHSLLFNPDSSQCVLPWKCPNISPSGPLP
ncbi:uncharacterized protein LOC123511611 [Portunus trituberculatus]|nr:uncharacterized protein LOC123511611 [Portunus trituberculatus]